LQAFPKKNFERAISEAKGLARINAINKVLKVPIVNEREYDLENASPDMLENRYTEEYKRIMGDIKDEKTKMKK
jgi:hypothetical protein